jgi:hypothetical protein
MRAVPPPYRPESGEAIASAEVLLRGPPSSSGVEVADCLNNRVVGPGALPTSLGEPVECRLVERRVVHVRLLSAARVVGARLNLLSAITPGDLDIGCRDFDLGGVVRVMGNWDHPTTVVLRLRACRFGFS